MPGRPSRIETTTVIVDDVWALVGTSTFRRRGLTFDGSTDLALTDTVLEEGACPSLRDFRRTLLATRLGIPPLSGALADPRHVRLADGAEMVPLIRDQLLAGEQSRVEPLWPGTRRAAALPQDLADPDGAELELTAVLALTALTA
ncbi:hypothetical protein LO762_09135 [Actinocorallia sp. API 0066]|uniref:hypothetical protein n=1 Tax=Actinocorallia sp. API 0066 TaxID=2896846 RepID=UPI001E4F36AF|nr:hypothetical protein [Actinocorallia sp. API 0066]MCD0449351.1 hypothetical protein [Actinocorallia sp. API 0066]